LPPSQPNHEQISHCIDGFRDADHPDAAEDVLTDQKYTCVTDPFGSRIPVTTHRMR